MILIDFCLFKIRTGYPFPVSRPHSRVASRATSPALSSKSRKSSSMSSRNLPVYRHSYIEPHLTDDESSESIASYMDDLDIRHNKRDKRDSAGRSIRSSRQSSKSSPQRSFDEDSEEFSRRSYRHSVRERRANSLASSRTDNRRPNHIRSDSTQDSETEIGTRALVQAKIREKVARAENENDESSTSDLWKPKPTTPSKIEKNVEKEVTTEASTPKSPASNETLAAKTVDKPVKIVTKIVADRRKSFERVVKPKSSTEAQITPKLTTKTMKSNASKASKTEPIKKSESSEPKSIETEKMEVSETDLNNLPETIPEGPPKTPDYEWTCEYCTFENEANVKICAVCCKTPSSAAIRKQLQISENETKPQLNGKHNDSANITKEGRGKKISRKISFWPGTKPK